MRLLIFLLLLSYKSLSQNQKKHSYFLNEKGETITQDKFHDQSKTGKYTWTDYETKDSVNIRLIYRESYGRIDTIQKRNLLKVLKQVTGTTVNQNQTIIINFSFLKDIPNQKHCIDFYTSQKSYRNFFKGKEQFAQFYITEIGFKYSKKFVFEDKNDEIRKMLFPYGVHCNYIIIKPDGRFYKQMGEHRQDVIPQIAKSDW
ncbi:hypothetical protein [Flavobacterium sp. AG291]|uniref:hypothetical protein n=1 Tax=Flavobacterium sp. AG291 TaxID=2184000 RepID=UPI000E0B06E3|nr:hypothetical protein [Flavobacterium sp. AG291]RDI14491.1 hypothetical protein DEU42_102188 [Flavobacterium sp. AG291]